MEVVFLDTAKGNVEQLKRFQTFDIQTSRTLAQEMDPPVVEVLRVQTERR